MFLHAHTVAFGWPHGADFAINAPLPPELGALIDQLASRAGGGRSGAVRAPRNLRGATPPRAR